MEINKVIAIEGTDGSGKGTQANMLYNNLKNNEYSVAMLDFPDYNGKYGKEIGKMLKSGPINKMDPKEIATWYANDRKDVFESFYKEATTNYYDYLILNRSTYSNIVYQISRLKWRSDRVELAEWIINLEKSMGIPLPDLTFIMDIDFDLSVNNGKKKEAREYIEENTLDANEKNEELIKNVIYVYRNLTQYLPNSLTKGKGDDGKFFHILCNHHNKTMRDRSDIQADILSHLLMQTYEDKLNLFLPFNNTFLTEKFGMTAKIHIDTDGTLKFKQETKEIGGDE